MRFKTLAFLALLVSIFVSGCDNHNPVSRIGQAANSDTNPAASPQTAQADGARRVTTKELDALMKKNEVFIVDVRNQASFDAGHIPGAKLIPAGEILNHVNELPKNKLIVTYCS